MRQLKPTVKYRAQHAAMLPLLNQFAELLQRHEPDYYREQCDLFVGSGGRALWKDQTENARAVYRN